MLYFKRLVFILMLIPTAAFAQQSLGEMHLTSITGFTLRHDAATIYTGKKTIYQSKAVVGLNFDVGINRAFSLGLGVSHQKVELDYVDYVWADKNNQLDTENVHVNISRINLGLRGLVHYMDHDKIDLYSGMNFNFRHFKLTHNSHNPNFDYRVYSLPVNVQLILLGIKASLTPHWALNAELAYASPYFATAGVCYRFE